jgi:hypothetical protein
MRKLALALALLIAGGVLVPAGIAFADDDAMKKCEAETDAAKKEKCMKKAKGG